MAKSIVFHIGDPKTGTSSIQRTLRDRSFTSPRATVDYPDQLNAFPLANTLCDDAQAHHRDQRFGAAAAWLNASTADVAVISAEMFFKVDPLVMNDAIAQYMPDHAASARIFAYVRPHAQRFLSQFVQVSKTGLYWGDMQTLLQRVSKKDLLTYTPRFQAWRRVFGDRFMLRPMVRDELADRDVVTDFFKQVLGDAPFTVAKSTAANESLPLEVLAGLRAVHGTLKRLEIGPDNRHAVGQYYVNILNALCEGRGTKIRLGRSIRDQIAEMCAADARALDQAFFDRPIMQTALEASAEDTVPEMMSADAGAHFAPDTLKKVRAQSRRLAKLLTEDRATWRQSFYRDIGQLPPDAALDARIAAKAGHIKQVQTALAAIATTITGDFISTATPEGGSGDPQKVTQA